MADAVPVEQPIPWWVKPALAAYAMTIFAALAGASCFIGDNTLRTTMFTAAVTLLLAASAYYFGSSAGSDKKDNTIAANTAALASSTPAPPPATVEPSEPSDEVKALAAKVTGNNAP